MAAEHHGTQEAAPESQRADDKHQGGSLQGSCRRPGSAEGEREALTAEVEEVLSLRGLLPPRQEEAGAACRRCKGMGRVQEEEQSQLAEERAGRVRVNGWAYLVAWMTRAVQSRRGLVV